MRLRIVIPTLDEAAGLAPALDSALAASGDIVVSDGGSDDGTVELARARGARIVEGPRGRGRQLNAGAALAGDHDVLLFLHADTVLPAGAASAIGAAIASGAKGGAFRVRFAGAGGGAGPLLALGGRLANARAALTGWPLGDHAQFARRDAFDALGGFRDWPILEDLDFARRLRRHGRTVLLRATVETSARRFERLGVPRTVAINWLIFALYGLGVPPRRLEGLYYDRHASPKSP